MAALSLLQVYLAMMSDIIEDPQVDLCCRVMFSCVTRRLCNIFAECVLKLCMPGVSEG